jgi:hypothetical protein
MSNENLFIAEGDEAREFNEKKRSDRKIRFLKKNQTFRGRFLMTKFNAYAQHSTFDMTGKTPNVKSHACLDPGAKKEHRASTCPSCQAGVPVKAKTLVWWYDIENGEIVVRDVPKTAMDAIYKAVDQYGEDLLTDTFDISMSDKGAVSIMYIKPKKGEDFPATPADVAVGKDEYDYVMNVLSPDEIAPLIAPWVAAQKAGNAAGDGATIVRTDGAGKANEDDVPF